VVTDLWSTIYKRSCQPVGCLPSDGLIQVSIGTFLTGLSLVNQWWELILPDNSRGYIEASVVGYTDITVNQPEIIVRYEIVNIASKLLGWYYTWGGRSAFNAQMWTDQTQLTGVDCSGLASISYKTVGLLLPRDADGIYRKSKNVTSPALLQPADLFFFADPSLPNHMVHVMVIALNETIIESNIDGPPLAVSNGTRTILISTKFGLNKEDLLWGKPVPTSGLLIFLGNIFPLF